MNTFNAPKFSACLHKGEAYVIVYPGREQPAATELENRRNSAVLEQCCSQRKISGIKENIRYVGVGNSEILDATATEVKVRPWLFFKLDDETVFSQSHTLNKNLKTELRIALHKSYMAYFGFKGTSKNQLPWVFHFITSEMTIL